MVELAKPWLWLPAEVSHALSLPALKAIGAVKAPTTFSWRSFSWRGLNFANPLGTSGGIDKNADLIRAFWALGAGFVEVGTVTPKAQGPNPGRIIRRAPARQALWNKMGFPNEGATAAKARLEKLSRPHHTPIFVNIGKNRETPNSQAVEDYLYGLRAFHDVADAFVVNISSPNTAGLRELLEPKNLGAFLEPLVAEALKNQKPLLLKLSPDMEDSVFKSALDVSHQVGVAGWVLTNTTLAREPGLNFPNEGGMSGLPLAARSKHLLRLAVDHLGARRDDKLLVSAGGILSPADVFERLQLGAHLIQVYAALVFDGPLFFRRVAQQAES